MNTQIATTPAADDAMRVASVEVAGASRAMFYASASALPMLRGPRVAYAPEDDGGASIQSDDTPPAEGGGEQEEPADQHDGAELETDDDGNPIAPAEDFDEVEYGEGKKFKLPRELNRGFLREADYTQKTQALAQERQAFAAEQSQHAEMTTALRSQIGAVHALQERVERFKAVPWDQLRAEDPDTWRELSDDYRVARDALTEANQALEKGENEYRSKLVEDTHKHLASVDQALADPRTGIAGWGPQKAQELATFAGTQGYTAADLQQASASDWKILNLAAEGAKALKAKQQVQRHTKAQETTPSAPIKGNAPPRGLTDRMSTAEWMRQRNAEAAKAR